MKRLSIIFLLLFSIHTIAQWRQINSKGNSYLKEIAVKDSLLFAVYYVDRDTLFSSADYGKTWIDHSSKINAKRINSIHTNNKCVFACTDSGVFRSTDNGSSWEKKNDGLPPIKYVRSITEVNSNLYLITAFQDLYKSINNGDSWGKTSFNSSANCISGDNNNLFVGSFGMTTGIIFGIFSSHDSGNSWKNINAGLTGSFIKSLLYHNSIIYAAVYKHIGETTSGYLLAANGIYISSDQGNNWSEYNSGLTNLNVADIYSRRDKIFAVYDRGGLCILNPYKNRWESIVDNLPYTNKYMHSANDKKMFVGTSQNEIWIRNIDDIVTPISKENEFLPSVVSLSQNYPNPFNPETTINYQLPTPGFVTLKIYDLLGREVATLVDEYKQPGTYKTTLNVKTLHATSLPSGVYFHLENHRLRRW